MNVRCLFSKGFNSFTFTCDRMDGWGYFSEQGRLFSQSLSFLWFITFLTGLEASQLFLMSRHFVLGDSRLAMADFLSLSSLVLPTLPFFSRLVNLCSSLCCCQDFPLHDDWYRKKGGKKVQRNRSSVKNLILAPLLLVFLSRWSISLVLPSMWLLLQEPQGGRRRRERHLLQRAHHLQLGKPVWGQLPPGNSYLWSSQSSVTSSYQGPNPG